MPTAIRFKPAAAWWLLGLLAGCAWSATPAEDTAGVLGRVAEQKAWLDDARQCPAELMPARETAVDEEASTCSSPKLDACMARCVAGSGVACYWLANALQHAKAPAAATDTLFQHACKLGVVSGCTNRAAGLMGDDTASSPHLACTLKTFEKTCAHDDPWGCNMYALQLSEGWGGPKNKALALRALEKSCKHGRVDEACGYGKQLRDDIEHGAD